MKKFFRVTTIPLTINLLLKGQLNYFNQYFDVVAVSSEGADLQEIAQREKVRTIALNMEREIAPVKDAVSFFRLLLLLMKEKPAILTANTPKGSLLSLLAAKLAGVKHRVYIVTGLRFESETGKKKQLLINMEKLACWAATKVVPEGEGVKKTLQHYKVTGKPLQVIGNGNINGVDLAYYDRSTIPAAALEQVRQQYQIQPDDKVFCFVGRIVKEKGMEELVAAFCDLHKTYPNTKLMIVGPVETGGEGIRREVFSQIDAHPAIIMTGFQKDIRPYLAVSSALMLPSYREGFPNVVLQAGAMGLPCIVSDISGCNEIIKNGFNGLLVPKEQTQPLYEAMRTLVTDPVLLQQMSAVSRGLIAEKFDQQYVWAEWLKMYQSLA
jgi:glycosyltransferase involved in cell wall biosynthesis